MKIEDPRTGLYRRLVVAFVALGGVLVIGASGYHYLGEGRWSWTDCFYMTVITLSTVGFGELLHNMGEVEYARMWTVMLIVLGSGTLVYFVSNLTALIVEGDLQGVLRRRRMEKRVDKLHSHVVVCGVGSTGHHVVHELATVGVPYVVVDHNAERLARIAAEMGEKFLYVVGDATDDDTLQEARVTHARGVIAALHEDKDNLFVTITARALNPSARIVAKAVEPSAEAKLRRAGADAVVSPNFIGGMRLVSEMIRPSVVEFLDRMLRDPKQHLRIEEILVPKMSPIARLPLAKSRIRDTGAMVIAVRKPDGEYFYNPAGDLVLEPGTQLIVIARSEDVHRLRELIGEAPAGAIAERNPA